MPWLKGIAASTAFIFTFTSILPAALAQDLSDQTLRNEQEEEKSPDDVAAQLSTALLQGGNAPNPVADQLSQTLTPDTADIQTARPNIWATRNGVVVSAVPVAAPDLPAIVLEQKAPPAAEVLVPVAVPAGFEETPVVPQWEGPNRRTFLKVGALAATYFALPQALRAQDPGVAAPVGPPLDFDLKFGLSGQPNTVFINYRSSQVNMPKPDKLSAPRGMRSVHSIAQSFGIQWKEWAEDGARLISRLMSYENGIPDPSEVWTDKWKPGHFGQAGPQDTTSLRSYVMWAPWLTDEKWWPVIFQGMRKAASVGHGQTAAKPHSRIYLDTYGAVSFFRPWQVDALARFVNLANKQGVEVVPILGDPLMAAYPTAGTYLLRSLIDTETMVPDSNGVVHVAYDIEPNGLDNYEKARNEGNDEKIKFWWNNVMLIVEETKQKLSRTFQEASAENRFPDVEVTLFVPPDFPAFAQRMGIVVPRGVRLVVMTYAHRANEVGNLAAQVRTAFDADRATPVQSRSFNNVSYGTAVDIGMAKDTTHAFWRDPDHPNDGKIGDRTAEAGRLTDAALRGGLGYNGERVIHTHNMLDLIWFLRDGGPTLTAAADRELKEYLSRGFRIFGEFSAFISGSVRVDEKLPFGALPNGHPDEEKAARIAELGGQRAAAGMAGLGAGIAHLNAGRNSAVRRTLAPDKEMFLFGPDTGFVYSLLGLIDAANFGAEARMQAMSRTIVDPSGIGFEIPLRDSEKIECVELLAETAIQGRTYPAGSLFVKDTVVPAGTPTRVKTAVGAADGSVKVHGTRLRDGTVNNDGTVEDNGKIVPGRVVVDDPDVFSDGTSPRRQANDLRLTQLASNRYDVYWSVHVSNTGSRKFAGFVNLRPNTGFGEALDVNTESITLQPGEQKIYTMKIAVGYDDYDIPVDLPSREDPDPFKGKGRLLRNLPVSEAAFLVNEAAFATASGEFKPEIVDAAGLAAFDPIALTETLRDKRFRPRLVETARAAIRDNQLSTLSSYGLDRPIGVHVALPAGQDLDAPVNLIQSLAALQRSHGVTDVLVDAGDIQTLINEVVAFRVRFNLIDLSEEQRSRLIAELSTNPAAVRLRRLLAEAHKLGLRVGFQVQGENAHIKGMPMTPQERARDPNGTQAYFRVLKEITEDLVIGIEATHFTAVKNHAAVRPEDMAYGIRLYQNAQAPLILMGNRDQIVSVGGRQVFQAQDLTAEPGNAQVVARLDQARRENRGLGLVVLTPEQCAPFARLDDGDTEQLVTQFVGPEIGERLSKGGIVSPDWLVQKWNHPRRYLPPVVRIPGDALRLSTISKMTTGHLSLQAAHVAPDPTRPLYFRVRVFNKDTGILKTMEVPVKPSTIDVENNLPIVIGDMPRGRYAINVELASGIFDPVIPGQTQLTETPFVVIQDKPAFTVINPGVENKLQLGRHDVRLAQAEPVTVTVNGRPRFMEEHWTFTTDSGAVLHFGRDRTRQTLTYWIDNGAATELLGNIPQRTTRANVRLDGIPVTVQINGTTNRMAVIVDGVGVEIWSLLDQKMTSRWDQAAIIQEENQTLKVTVDPTGQAVPRVEVLARGAANPVLASSLPTDVRDTTADQVTEHPRRAEYIGRILAGVSALVPAGAVVRGAVRGARRLQTAIRDTRVRTQERQNEPAAQSRAAARATARGETAVPRPIQQTLPEGSVNWGTRLWNIARILVVAAVVCVLLTQVPAIASLAALSVGFATPMAALVKVVGIGLIIGWVDGLLQAIAPVYYQHLRNGFGTVISIFSGIGKIAQVGTVVVASWIWITSGLSIVVPFLGLNFSIPSIVTICTSIGAFQPIAALAALVGMPVLGAVAAVLVMGFVIYVVYRMVQGYRKAQGEGHTVDSWIFGGTPSPGRGGVMVGILGALNNLASIAFTIGVGLGIAALFGFTWPGFAALTVAYALKVAGAFIVGGALAWLIGEFGPTVLPGIVLMFIRMFEGAFSSQNLYLNNPWQNRKIAVAQYVNQAIHWFVNRTPVSVLIGFAGVALLAKGPALLAAIPVIGIIGSLLMTLMAAPATGTVVAVVVGVGLTVLGTNWLWRTIKSLTRRAVPPTQSLIEMLRQSAAEQMVTGGEGLPTDANAAANRQQEVLEVQIPAIQQLVAGNQMTAAEALQLINVLRAEVGLPVVNTVAAGSAVAPPPIAPLPAGLEETSNQLHREILRFHALRDAETFVGANAAALGIPAGGVLVGPNDTPNLSAFINTRIGEVNTLIGNNRPALGITGPVLPGPNPHLRAYVDRLPEGNRPATLRGLARQLRVSAETAGTAPTLIAELRRAADRIEAPENLVKGLAFRREPFEVMVQLDMGAKFAGQPYPGQTRVRPPWYGQTLKEVVQDLRADPFKSAIFSGIFVFPSAGLDQWNMGLNAVGVPVVFGSQFIQYTASMMVRWSLAQMGGSQPRRIGSFVRSEMDPDFWNFQIQVQGRWLTGHQRMVANALFGESLHYDPDLMRPKTLDSVPGAMGQLAQLMAQSTDIARQVAGQTSRIHPFKNFWYQIGEQPEFRELRVMDFNDITDNNVTDIADEEALGGYTLDKGVKVVRLHGRNMDGVWLHTLVNLEIGLDGQVRVGRHPTKFDARFGPEAPQTPKSSRMALALAVMGGIYDVVPQVAPDGNGILLTGATPWSQAGNPIPGDVSSDVPAAHEAVMDVNRHLAQAARAAYLGMAPNINSNGSINAGGLEEWAHNGVVPLGPKLGWEPQDYMGGEVRQFLYRLADVAAMRRWSEGWPDANRPEPLLVKAKETLLGSLMSAGIGALIGLFTAGPAGAVTGAIIGFATGVLTFLHPVSRTLVARIWYTVSLPLWAGFYLFYNGVIRWFGLIGMLLLSRFFLEPFFRTPIPVSFWGFRKDPIISSLRYDYNPRHIVALTERATGRSMQQIPAAVAAGDQRTFLGQGLAALRAVPNLEGYVIDLARGASPERYDERPNVPEEYWELTYAELIRPLFSRIPAGDRLAAQYAILHIIQGHRAAAGQPEDLISALNTGSHEPGVPSLGDRNRVMMWFRDHASNAAPHSRIPSLLGAMERMVNQRTRSWGWAAHSTPIGGIRVGSVHANPVQAWLDSGSTLSYSEWLLGEQSSLQPDTDSVVQLSAMQSRAILQGPRAALADPTSQLNGVPRLLGLPIVSPELYYSGMLHPGGKPHRFPILDGILYHISHGLDRLGIVGRVVNRLLGLGVSVGLGYWAATTIPGWIIGMAAGWGALATMGIIAGWALAGLVIVIAASAAITSLYSCDGQDGYRLDEWVNRATETTWRGDGIRALSVIPGFATWVVSQLLFRFVFRVLDEVVAVPYPNYSWDAWVLALSLGTTPGKLFPGLVHKVHWPFWFGPLPPGLPYLSITLWLRSATVWDSAPIPASVALRLANEPEWTRVVTQFNYGSSGQITRHPYPDETLAEDTKVNATMKITPVLLPSSPAESVWRAEKMLREYLQARDEEAALRRAVNFAKGMGMASANFRLRGGSDAIATLLGQVRAMPVDQQTGFFASIMSALEAFDRNEVSTAGSRGAGVYSYLFTAFTASPLFSRMVGMYAPGEVEGFLLFLMYAHLDDQYGGAITQQLTQLQRENGRAVPPITGTLMDQDVREALLEHGTFVDPNLALAAVWVQQSAGRIGPLQSTNTFRLSQNRRISDYKVNVIYGIDLLPPSIGGIESLVTDAMPNLRTVNRIFRSNGRDSLIVASADVLMELELSIDRPVGSAPLNPFTMQSGLEETPAEIEAITGISQDPVVRASRRDFLRDLFAGGAAIATASYTTLLTLENAAAQPPVAVPAGDANVRTLRDLQGQLLSNQASFGEPRLRFLRANLARLQRLRSAGAVSLSELEEGLTAVETAPLFAAEGRVLQLLRSYLSGRTPRAGEDARAVAAQITAAIENARAVVDFFAQQLTRAQQLRRTNAISQEEYELISASASGSRFQLGILRELQGLYEDLARIGGYLPLPIVNAPGFDVGASVRDAVPPLPGEPARLAPAEQARLMRSVRLHIFRMLEIEKERLDVNIDIRRRLFERAARLNALNAISRAELEMLRFLNAQADQLVTLKNVLTAQQWVTLVAGGIDHPDNAAGRPANLLTAQQRLDTAIVAQTGALVLLADQWVTYRSAEMDRARLLQRGRNISDEEVSNITLNLARARDQRSILLAQRDLDTALRGLGFPAGILQLTQTVSSSLDIQALVQPAQIGLAEEPDATAIERLERAANRAQADIYQRQADALDAEIEQLRLDADRITRLLAVGAINAWARDDAADMVAQITVYQAQKRIRLAEKDIWDSENQEDFDAGVRRFEDAAMEATTANRDRVRARAAVLAGRAGLPRGAFTQAELDFFAAQAGSLTIRARELDLRARLNTELRRQNLPIVDLDRPAGSASASASPESLQLVLSGATLPIGTVRRHVDGRAVLLLPGARWVWLAGPPVLGEPNEWVPLRRMVQIREGDPGAGRFILPEYSQLLRADSGALEGPLAAGTVGRRFFVTSWGTRPYQMRSGYYRVEGFEGGVTLDTQDAIRLGAVIRTEPGTGRVLESTHGLIGYAAYAVRQMPTAGGGTRREYAPLGVVTLQIPLERPVRDGGVYYNMTEEADGRTREAPIPLSRIGLEDLARTPDGRPIYGELYLGGLKTYGERGIALYGRRNVAGERLVPVFERVGPRLVPVEKEARIVYDEILQRLIVSFDNHAYALPAQPAVPLGGPPQQPQAQAPQEDQGIPWGLWAGGAGALAVAVLTGAGIVWLVRRRNRVQSTETSASGTVTDATGTDAVDTGGPVVTGDQTEPPPTAGAEEKGTPEVGQAALRTFLATVGDATMEGLSPFDPTRPVTPLTDSFPQLQQMEKDAGYAEGVAELVWFSKLPSAPLISTRNVFVQKGVSWNQDGQVEQSLKGYVHFVATPELADLIIGEDRAEIRVSPRQAFLQVNADTAKAVTPGLLKHLEDQHLLNPGSVVVLDILLKRVGDDGEDVRLFA